VLSLPLFPLGPSSQRLVRGLSFAPAPAHSRCRRSSQNRSRRPPAPFLSVYFTEFQFHSNHIVVHLSLYPCAPYLVPPTITQGRFHLNSIAVATQLSMEILVVAVQVRSQRDGNVWLTQLIERREKDPLRCPWLDAELLSNLRQKLNCSFTMATTHFSDAFMSKISFQTI